MPSMQEAAARAQSADASLFDWDILVWGFVGGLIVVAVSTAVAMALLVRGLREPEPVKSVQAHDGIEHRVRVGVNFAQNTMLPAGAKWSFSDSWATNLTALIAATGAVAAIFLDDLKDVFGTQAPLAYMMTMSAMLVVAALAPVVYTVFQRQVASAESKGPSNDGAASTTELQGTLLGWCLSAAVTAYAVSGSLSAAFRFSLAIGKSSGVAWVICVAIVVVIVLVMAYVVRSFFILFRAVQPGSTVNVNSLVGLVTVSCCSGVEGTTRARISLL